MQLITFIDHNSRFCDLYRDWAGRLDRVMRQEHRAGEKLFVDYAGQTVPIIDRGYDRYIADRRLTRVHVGASSGLAPVSHTDGSLGESAP